MIAKEKADAELKAKQEEEDMLKKEKEKNLENANCIRAAKQYINYTAFSRSGLYEQLAYEGFSDEQIQYGLSQVGY